MATTGTRHAAPAQSGLQELAKRHLWMHFTRHGAFDKAEVPIIARGDEEHRHEKLISRIAGAWNPTTATMNPRVAARL